MTNGISFSPSEEDDREYSPEQLYSYIVFANRYVEKTIESLKGTGQDEWDHGWKPDSKHKDILNAKVDTDVDRLVAIALAEHNKDNLSQGFARNIRSIEPNDNGTYDYGLWQINRNVWEEKLKRFFPELFDNGKTWEENIYNPYINAVAAVYIAGYKFGLVGGNHWTTWSEVNRTFKKDEGGIRPSDYLEDAREGIDTELSKERKVWLSGVPTEVTKAGKDVEDTMQADKQELDQDLEAVNEMDSEELLSNVAYALEEAAIITQGKHRTSGWTEYRLNQLKAKAGR